MRPALAAASAILLVCAAPLRAENYLFEGKWDCEVGTFTFTDSTYDPGGEVMDILDVARDGSTFVLTFADDYQLGLSMNPDGTMEWFSAVSGDSFTCRPLP
ncbi:hypothetical protein [Pseudogemmobacter blasticus]|uniref:Uncharacterized protein n=1 Tax=Fuscovulum blasticum DSM 2131 TaxID=1188250 RepID=A0A2T4J4E3_FUSBL|nr:hypothetical protein [Fuscovulum blasticum]PTE12772.1 hypothetical protein C5F44_16655 [Fuscovulum blasticum DSM 2131]